MAVETEKRGKRALEKGAQRGGLDRIPWLGGGGVTPDDERTIVGDRQQIMAVRAPAKLEDHSCVLPTD